MTKKVVIIDDSITALSILKTAFIKNGWDVYETGSALGAMDLIFKVAPDLIITDAIMPEIGGFKLIKTIRYNEKISQIPIIIYSVLDEKNAKFYIKDDERGFFLKKDDDLSKILNLAQNVVEKFPIDDNYKKEILDEIQKETIVEQVKTELKTKNYANYTDIEDTDIYKELTSNFNNGNGIVKYTDNELMDFIFKIMYPVFRYNLSTISLYSKEKGGNTVFFDIKNIILSPVFTNKILEKYDSKIPVMFKKYSPHIETVKSMQDFKSKIEFDFEYDKKIITSIAFYSKEEDAWKNTETQKTKEMLNNFFKTRYLAKNPSIQKKNSYNKGIFNVFKNKDSSNFYLCIIEILNYSEIQEQLSSEEADILNSKISEKIINCLNENEQVQKTPAYEQGDYTVMLYADNEQDAYQKLNYILESINSIGNIQSSAGACKCIFDRNFDMFEAGKIARKALENTNEQEKVVIKNAQ